MSARGLAPVLLLSAFHTAQAVPQASSVAAAAAQQGADCASCRQKLQQSCDPARRSSTGNCLVCTGTHSHPLQEAGCQESDLDQFCNNAAPPCHQLPGNATGGAPGLRCDPTASPPEYCPGGKLCPSSGECPEGNGSVTRFTPYRTANFLSDSAAFTAVVTDPTHQVLFAGTSCTRKYSDEDCQPLSGVIQKWDTSSQCLKANLTAHNASITSLVFDPARQLLWSASDEADEGECCGNILQWDTSTAFPTYTVIQSDHGHELCSPRAGGAARVGISALHYESTSQRLFGSCASTVMQWDLSGNTPTQLPSVAVNAHADSAGELFNAKQRLASLQYDPMRQWLFAILYVVKDSYSSRFTATRNILRWSTEVTTTQNSTRLPDLSAHLGGVLSLVIDAATGRLFSGSATNELITWDVSRSYYFDIKSDCVPREQTLRKHTCLHLPTFLSRAKCGLTKANHRLMQVILPPQFSARPYLTTRRTAIQLSVTARRRASPSSNTTQPQMVSLSRPYIRLYNRLFIH